MSDLAARARQRADECELALYRTDAALYRSLADRVDELERFQTAHYKGVTNMLIKYPHLAVQFKELMDEVKAIAQKGN